MYYGIDYGVRKIHVAELSDHGVLTVTGKVSPVRGDWALTQLMDVTRGQVHRSAVCVVVESPWVGINPRTAVALGIACGVIYATVSDCTTVTPHLVEPASWKKQVVGTSRGGKQATMDWLHRNHPEWDGLWDGDDSADAICMALLARKLSPSANMNT
jgi:Holliday junction resolvasome RuvABC endonuclease subunit